MSSKDEHYMRECLRLAVRGRGQVSPNPMVGALLVRNGRIIARGWHEVFGGPHAEVNCLRRARGVLSKATLYVNLEPCSHTGKTPPCADLIVRSGIGHVVVAMVDPNRLVRGRGIRRLRQAGVKVTLGVLEKEARALNRAFVAQVTRHRPYVHVKIAQSLDGFIASPNSRGRWITSPESRRRVHALRAQYDAILVGAGTIRADNPRLTVRDGQSAHPIVVVLSGRHRVPEDARVFKRGRGAILVTQQQKRRSDTVRRLESRGVRILPVPGRRGRLSLHKVLHDLYKWEIGSVLVEGGGEVFGQFVRENLVDELTIFIAPQGLGSGLSAFGRWQGTPTRIPWLLGHRVSVEVSGGDLQLHARREED